MKKHLKPLFLSPLASTILQIGMPLISIVFIYILITLINTPANEKAWLYASAYTMLEYAVMSFTILFCGATVADMAQKYY